jgi:hypothetical protein
MGQMAAGEATAALYSISFFESSDRQHVYQI